VSVYREACLIVCIFSSDNMSIRSGIRHISYVNLLCAMRITMFGRLNVLKNNVFQLILIFSDLKFNSRPNDNKDYKECCRMIIAVSHPSRTR